MLNNTVNRKEIIERAAGKNDKTTTTAVAWQNNRPQKLEIEVTNNTEAPIIPFIMDNGDIVANTDKEVIVKAKDITPEVEKMRKQKGKNNGIEVGD